MGGLNSGRKSNEIELAKKIEVEVANITTEALIDIARSKVFNQVRQLGNSKKALKSTIGLALPILLKSIKEHKQIEVSEVKPLLSAIRGEIVKDDVAQQAFSDTIKSLEPGNQQERIIEPLVDKTIEDPAITPNTPIMKE